MDGLDVISGFSTLSNMETLKSILSIRMTQSHLCLRKIFMNVIWRIDWWPRRRERLEAERIIMSLA